jgi:hypothetical protein
MPKRPRWGIQAASSRLCRGWRGRNEAFPTHLRTTHSRGIIAFGEDLLAARRRYVRIAMAASALATLPYLVFNVGVIVTAEGSIVHMAPGEWAIFTAVSSVVLWLECATILAVSAIVTRHNPWLSTPLALLIFTGIAVQLVPYSWTGIFNPLEYGFGSWVFLTGILSTICVLLLKWMAKPEVTLD